MSKGQRKPSFFTTACSHNGSYNQRHYTVGWNARCKRQDYDVTKSQEWREGWVDCDKAPKTLQLPIEK